MSLLVAHARRELVRAGLFDEDSDYNGQVALAVLELVLAFSNQRHSGETAGMTLELFKKLASFETLTPITSDPAEWNDVTAYGPRPLWQNRRNPAIFSDDEGKTWWHVDDR